MKRLLAAVALSSAACAFQDVRVTSEPPKAGIWVDGSARGPEPVTARLSTDSFANMLGKKHEIVAKLDGYEDESLALESDSNFFSNTHPFPNSVTLKLKPLPGQAEKLAEQRAGKAFPTAPAVDSFPPGKPRPDDVAVVIGNADYSRQAKDIPDVRPAYADAEGFKRYAEAALGVPPGNVIFL